MARRMLFILSRADDGDGSGCEPALAQASVAAAMDVDVQLVFTGAAGAMLLEPRLDQALQDGSGRSLRQGLQQARELGVRLLICSPALARFGDAIADQTDEVVGAAWLVSESLRDDTVVLTY